jgi:hypothetical protein
VSVCGRPFIDKHGATTCGLDSSHFPADCSRRVVGAIGTEHRDMLIERLAEQLLDQAIAASNTEVQKDGVWVHGATCPGFCDYACGAIWIGVLVDHDGERTITEVESGTLRVGLT